MTRVNRCATGALLLTAVWRWLTYLLAIRTDSGRGPSMSGRLRSAPVANRQALPIGFAASLGIHVTVLALGLLRTDWAGRSMVRAPRSIPDYDAVFDPIRAARNAKSGNQTGDPAAAARALLTVLESPDPPVHLVLGPDALRVREQRRQSFQTDRDAWMGFTMSTDFPADKQVGHPRCKSMSFSCKTSGRGRDCSPRPG